MIVGNRWEYFQNSNIHRLETKYLIFYLIFSTKQISMTYYVVKLIPSELIQSFNLKSNGFDVETEIMAKLSLSNQEIIEIPVHYSKRTYSDGKKLKLEMSYQLLKDVNYKVFND